VTGSRLVVFLDVHQQQKASPMWLMILSCIVLAATLCLTTTAAADACAGHNTKPVTNTLVYTGQQQHVKKDGSTYFRCFRGQHWEDLYVFQHLLHGVGNGFFIELGALDGYGFSVTYYYEIFQKWKGLLIEASPQNHQLHASRSRKMKPWQRRTVPYVKAAVCGEPTSLTYVSKSGTGAGILEFMAKDQQDRNLRMCSNRTLDENTVLGQNDCVLTPINCVHLGRLLNERGVEKIDLFVLDVEGAELEVLNTVDLKKTPVRYFLIELDGTATNKDAAVRCILRRNGYEPLGRLDLNELWHNPRFPHARFAAEYTSVAPSAWTRCFKGDGVSFLHPTPWFNRTGGEQHTEGAGVVTDEVFTRRPAAVVADKDLAVDVGLQTQFIIFALLALVLTAWQLHRRRGRSAR
jgi:FkbM family methyltransferase